MDTAPNLWQNGWWQPTRRTSSPNFCARETGEKISLAVLYNISLPPFGYNTGAAEKLFTNSIDEAEHPFYSIVKNLRISSHFLIARTGETVQSVSCSDATYHAGVSSFDGREKCDGFSVGIEIEGCDFEPFTEAQYTAFLPLLSALMEQYPVETVAGHQNIAPDRKTNPGHFFGWPRLEVAGSPIHRWFFRRPPRPVQSCRRATDFVVI